MGSSSYVWYHDGESIYLARLVSLGAYASMISYHDGMDWLIMVDNDDIEFIGDDRIDDED